MLGAFDLISGSLDFVFSYGLIVVGAYFLGRFLFRTFRTPSRWVPPWRRVAARWAEDPYARHELRYWNGTEWTEHVSDGGTTATDAPK
jgi:hypothetical protein